jgi:hypothetical protein
MKPQGNMNFMMRILTLVLFNLLLSPFQHHLVDASLHELKRWWGLWGKILSSSWQILASVKAWHYRPSILIRLLCSLIPFHMDPHHHHCRVVDKWPLRLQPWKMQLTLPVDYHSQGLCYNRRALKWMGM